MLYWQKQRLVLKRIVTLFMFYLITKLKFLDSPRMKGLERGGLLHVLVVQLFIGEASFGSLT